MTKLGGWFKFCRKINLELKIEPIAWHDKEFDNLLIKTNPYKNVEEYLSKIYELRGNRFWVSSQTAGYGKTTMLNFIKRYLLLNINKLRSLPILFTVTKSESEQTPLRYIFIKNMIIGFFNLAKDLDIIQNEFNINLDQKIKSFKEQLIKAKKKGIYHNLLKSNNRDLYTIFHDFVNETIPQIRDKYNIDKIVLLVDELDKVKEDLVLDFLGASQSNFQELLEQDYVVIFIAGHESWIRKIKNLGTEYSYYASADSFDLVPIFDKDDAKRLIDTRLSLNNIKPEIIPWDDDAIRRIIDISGGVPRNILIHAKEVLKFAYDHKINDITEDVVMQAFYYAQYRKEVSSFLSKHNIIFNALKQINRERYLLDVLLAFYSKKEEGIPIDWDTDQYVRTKYLFMESITNEEWISAVEKLTDIGAIYTRDDRRYISPIFQKFLDIFSKEDVASQSLSKLISYIIADMSDQLKHLEGVPDLMSAIRRIFSQGKWITEEQVISQTRDTKEFIELREKRKRENPIYSSQKIEEDLKNDVKQTLMTIVTNDASIITVSSGRTKYYKKLSNISQEDLKIAELIADTRLIDKYIDIIKMLTYQENKNNVKPTVIDEIIKEIDSFLNDLFLKRLKGKIKYRNITSSKIFENIDSLISFLIEISGNKEIATQKCLRSLINSVEYYITTKEQRSIDINIFRHIVKVILKTNFDCIDQTLPGDLEGKYALHDIVKTKEHAPKNSDDYSTTKEENYNDEIIKCSIEIKSKNSKKITELRKGDELITTITITNESTKYDILVLRLEKIIFSKILYTKIDHPVKLEENVIFFNKRLKPKQSISCELVGATKDYGEDVIEPVLYYKILDEDKEKFKIVGRFSFQVKRKRTSSRKKKRKQES